MPKGKAILWGIVFGLIAIWVANSIPTVGNFVSGNRQ